MIRDYIRAKRLLKKYYTLKAEAGKGQDEDSEALAEEEILHQSALTGNRKAMFLYAESLVSSLEKKDMDLFISYLCSSSLKGYAMASYELCIYHFRHNHIDEGLMYLKRASRQYRWQKKECSLFRYDMSNIKSLCDNYSSIKETIRWAETGDADSLYRLYRFYGELHCPVLSNQAFEKAIKAGSIEARQTLNQIRKTQSDDDDTESKD